eukprot:COSAG02_NODE_1857_length_10645_cov_24.485302_10_plen_132_part_00
MHAVLKFQCNLGCVSRHELQNSAELAVKAGHCVERCGGPGQIHGRLADHVQALRRCDTLLPLGTIASHAWLTVCCWLCLSLPRFLCAAILIFSACCGALVAVCRRTRRAARQWTTRWRSSRGARWRWIDLS